MELDHSGFSTQGPTVYAGNIGNNKYIIQVSAMGVRLLEGGNCLTRLQQWKYIEELYIVISVCVFFLFNDMATFVMRKSLRYVYLATVLFVTSNYTIQMFTNKVMFF